MDRKIYVNGKYQTEATASVSVFDRGLLFADAVYEVIPVVRGSLITASEHIERLFRSLMETKIVAPFPKEDFFEICSSLVSANNVENGRVYLQVTRGVAERDFLPPTECHPTVIAFTQKTDLSQVRPLKVVSIPDLRWSLRHIKTTQLTYAVMAKMSAVQSGADDAWFIEDGLVTEGTSNNALIVTKDGSIRTAPLTGILAGVTRAVAQSCAAQSGLSFVEEAFALEEAYGASEAFVTSASHLATPVIAIDGNTIGNGKIGEVTQEMRNLLLVEFGIDAQVDQLR